MNAMSPSATAPQTETMPAEPMEAKAKEATKPAKGKGKRPETVTKAPSEVMSQIARDEQTIARLTAENEALKEQLAKPAQPDKHPVDDAALGEAIADLQNQHRASLALAAKDGTIATLNLSLRSVLEFIPELTKEQSKVWRAAKRQMEIAQSNHVKMHVVEISGIFRRASTNPAAIMNARKVIRKKDGKVTAASMRAKGLAPALKTKGKGKNGAKPAQVAGKVPVPGNANPPAKVS